MGRNGGRVVKLRRIGNTPQPADGTSGLGGTGSRRASEGLGGLEG
jgi:hypothetical protein